MRNFLLEQGNEILHNTVAGYCIPNCIFSSVLPVHVPVHANLCFETSKAMPQTF